MASKSTTEMLGGVGVLAEVMASGVVCGQVVDVGVDGVMDLFGEQATNAEVQDVGSFGIGGGGVVGVEGGSADGRIIWVRRMRRGRGPWPDGRRQWVLKGGGAGRICGERGNSLAQDKAEGGEREVCT